MKYTNLIIGLLFYLLVDSSYAEQLRVAVASNFAGAMNEIANNFEKSTSHEVIVSPGSSGKLYAQIVNGAPFQVFFSADNEKPVALVNSGLAIQGSLFTYAVGRLVLWSAKPGIDVEAALRKGNFKKLALANPRFAPYGEAAVEFLQSQALLGSTEKSWVLGENIAQTWQFTLTGNADLGFVAMSQIMDGAISGSSWEIPPKFYRPIKQDAVVLTSASGNEVVIQFMDFVKSERGREIIASYGYESEQAR